MERKDRLDNAKSGKRLAIQEATLSLFSRKGYEGTTLEDIAGELGYAKTSLYYYFKSKEEIVRSLILESLEVSTRKMDELMQASPDPWDNLSGLIAMYIDEYSDQKSFFNIYQQVSANLERILTAEEGLEIRQKMGAMTHRIIGLIDCGVRGGDFRQEDPRLLAEMILGMLHGLMHQLTYGFNAGWDKESVKRNALAMLLAGIRNEKGPLGAEYKHHNSKSKGEIHG